MTESTKDLSIISYLIRRQQSFAFYRLPEQKKLCFLTQTTGKPEALSDMALIGSETGFILAPFRITKECPIWRIRPDYVDTDFPLKFIEETASNKTQANETVPSTATHKSEFNRYASCFHQFMEPLQKGVYDKLVLSRRVVYPIDSN